ncbi:MAG: MmcB family DNA repair protein [Parvibaculum sp.]
MDEDNALSHSTSDGRQSPIAAAVQRGVCRMLIHMGYMPLTELGLRSGRRADVAALSSKGMITIIEIKSSLADFRADQKWRDYLDFCDHFYFAVPPDFPLEVLPQDDEVGFILADKFGAEIFREPQEVKLAAGRRKIVTIAFARAAAARVHQVLDPGITALLTKADS